MASEQDGTMRVALAAVPVVARGQCVVVHGWFLAARTMRKSAELCFPTFSEGSGTICPWQH